MQSSDLTPRLRAETTSFVGRRAELAQAQALLRRCRLLTLVGPGGVGKTRLAHQLAVQLAGTFSDGVYGVELGESNDLETVIEQVASAMGVPTSADAVLDHLRAKVVLLVVDTCEHVVDACGALLREILLAAPGVFVLATSRQSLGVEGEHLMLVEPLPIPATIADVRAIEGQDAVTLLLRRVSASVPHFELSQENSSAILEICRKLDGLPLALEFVATWFRVLPAEEIVSLLSGATLLSGGPGRPLRQRTLAASLNWSRELCTPEERVLAEYLSVFRDGFTLEAATEIARISGLHSDGAVLGPVAGLVDKSVVARDSDQRIARYRMLEVTRALGEQELVASGVLEEVRDAHHDHFLRVAERFKTAWSGKGRISDIAAVKRERANVLAALEHGFADRKRTNTGVRLAILLERFWLNCGFPEEGRRWAGRAAAVPGISEGDRALVSGICALAAGRTGDGHAGTQFAEEAVWLAHRAGDDDVLADVLNLAGTTMLLADHPARALDHLTQAGTLTVDATPVLAITVLFMGDADQAIQLASTSLVRTENLQRGAALYALALCEWRVGKYELAVAHAVESIQIMHRFGDVVGLALSVELLAWIAAATGEGRSAGQLLGVAENMWRFSGCRVMFGSRTWLEPHHECTARTRSMVDRADLRGHFSAGLSASSSVDQAVDFVLSGLKPSGGSTRPSVLTIRELEIAKLIGEGATNKDVASTLMISPRTVATHVHNILKKLGLTSRVQIVAWLVQDPGNR
ncbi:LuxR C-terminal-related transcriptional regulator [Lentzea sp. NPDC034063]|uniref:LuxR C-terminal-related transcriptional regulator n=1 Tax=unclassified Lentzea TaxID=2643253 RepID=UPI0034082561